MVAGSTSDLSGFKRLEVSISISMNFVEFKVLCKKPSKLDAPKNDSIVVEY